MAALWRSWHSGGFYKATHHKSFSVTVCNPAANFNQPPAVELSKVFFWVAPVAAALSFWNANLRLLIQTSRAAPRNHRARTGAAFPAPPGATRSSTAPTPPTRRAAVSPCDVYIDVWNRVKIRKKKMAAPPVADQTDLVTQPCRLLLSPPPLLPLWRGNYCCVVFFFFFFSQITQTALTSTSWGWRRKTSSAATPPRCASTPRGSATAPTTAGTMQTRPTARVSSVQHKYTHTQTQRKASLHVHLLAD